jgi:D-3-phosphoglycerate dehydrogenase / 2-oxoglutarate reductase
MNILLLEPENFPKAAISILKLNNHKIFNCKQISEEIVDIIFVRLAFSIDKKFLSGFSNLKYIVSPTTGLTHIDCEHTKNIGVEIISFYDDKSILSDIRSTTELGIGLLIALLRKIPLAICNVQSGQWDRTKFKGSDINRKNVLVVGFGRLGIQIAKVYRVFGAQVSIYDKTIFKACEYDQVDNLKESIGKFDIISVHLDLNKSTEQLLSKDILSNISHNAYILNTSRGEVFDQKVLFEMVRSCDIAGLAVDVISNEFDPFTVQEVSILANEFPDRVIVTPHIGGLTKDSLEYVEIKIVEKLIKFISKGKG